MKRRTDRAKPSSDNTLNQTNAPSSSELKIPSRDNFEFYFQEFYKMFQHCKYNLVALNKRFDVLEKFFKSEVCSNSARQNQIRPNTFLKEELPNFTAEDWDYKEEKVDKVRKPKKKSQSKKKQDEDEESFPISMEDLEYLAQNFVSESHTPHGKNESTSKKKKAKYDVIVIDKKKMKVEEDFSEVDLGDLDYFDDENSIKINKNENIVKPDSFNQKLFDYKSFSNGKILNSETPKNSNNTNNLKPTPEDSKWLTKVNLEAKARDILLSNDQEILPNSFSAAMSLSLDKEENLNLMNKKVSPDTSNNSEKKESTRFSDFMRRKKEILNNNPDKNIIPKPKDISNNKPEESIYYLNRL